MSLYCCFKRINDSFFPYAATSFFQKICWQKHGDGEFWCHMIIALSCLTIAATLSTITKENCNAITEVTGSNLVDVAETVSVELSPLLNHQFKLAPNFFLLVVFAILNWLSSSVSRRRMNLCLCGIVNRKNGWMVSYPEKLIF